MNNKSQPSDERLRMVLREARPSPPLPPRFHQAVWRRIEKSEAPSESLPLGEWLDRAVAWLLQPRLALAGVAVMLLAGIAIGVAQGGSLANDMAKQRYITAVSPLASH